MKLSLRYKILLPILAVVFLTFSISTWYSCKIASDTLRSVLLANARRFLDNADSQINLFSDSLLRVMNAQSKNIDLIDVFVDNNNDSVTRAQASLKRIVEYSDSIQSANLVSTDGHFVLSSGDISKVVVKNRPYFVKAMNGEINISEPFMSEITFKPVLIFAAPLKNQGKIVGILHLRVDLGKFSEELIDHMKLTEGGYTYLLDSTGRVFCHPDRSLVLKLNVNDFDWGKNMMSQNSGMIKYEFNGIPKSAIFKKNETTKWMVVITVNDADIANAALPIRNSNMLIGICGLLLICLVVFLIVQKFLVGLNACVSFSEAIAGADLSRTLSVSQNDEVGVLADSLRKMVDNLKARINEACEQSRLAAVQADEACKARTAAEEAQKLAVCAKSEGMIDAANKIEGVVEVLVTASNKLSSEIEKSSRGASEESRRSTQTATSMAEMNTIVLDVAKNASQAAETAVLAKHKAENGATIVKQVVQGIIEVQSQAIDMKNDVSSLGQQAQSIGQIMNVISDIADQTNLLALNAAIEAARAGEAGRGFAVVADEVRKLAEKTMAATKEVGEAIHGIQNGTQKNIANVDNSVKKIDEATNMASKSGEALSEIVSLVDLTTDQVRSIATASDRQSAASVDITHNIEEVDKISCMTSDAMRQSAIAVEEVTIQVQMLKNLIDQIKGESGDKLPGLCLELA